MCITSTECSALPQLKNNSTQSLQSRLCKVSVVQCCPSRVRVWIITPIEVGLGGHEARNCGSNHTSSTAWLPHRRLLLIWQATKKEEEAIIFLRASCTSCRSAVTDVWTGNSLQWTNSPPCQWALQDDLTRHGYQMLNVNASVGVRWHTQLTDTLALVYSVMVVRKRRSKWSRRKKMLWQT